MLSKLKKSNRNFNLRWTSYFLRFSIAIGFLSAVLDRFGLWPKEVSAWGNWENFVSYSETLNPWFPDSFIPFVAILVTVLEIALALLLIIGFRVRLIGKASGVLLLLFALAMIINTDIKGVLDYSVLTASAAAFCLGLKPK